MYKTLILFFLEILPVLVFFIVGQKFTFSEATVVYIITTILTLSCIWLWAKRVSYISLILGTIVIGAGSLSVFFSNPQILLLVDTIYYLGAALVLLIFKINNINLYHLLFKDTFGMSPAGWDILVIRWIISLILVGIGNELVRQLGTIPDWFIFQISKTVLLTIFALYQFTLTKKYRTPHNTSSWGVRIN